MINLKDSEKKIIVKEQEMLPFEALPVAAMIVDAQGKILDINKEARILTSTNQFIFRKGNGVTWLQQI